jgi:hypothetical protein
MPAEARKYDIDHFGHEIMKSAHVCSPNSNVSPIYAYCCLYQPDFRTVLHTGHTTQAGTSWPGLVGRPDRPGISTLQIRKTKRRVGELDRIWSGVRGLRAIHWTLGSTPPGLPGQLRPGFLYGLWGALLPEVVLFVHISAASI